MTPPLFAPVLGAGSGNVFHVAVGARERLVVRALPSAGNRARGPTWNVRGVAEPARGRR